MDKDLRFIWEIVGFAYVIAAVISIAGILNGEFGMLLCFFIPVMFTFIVGLLTLGSDRYDDMLKENEEYYQKMQSGNEKPLD